MVIQQLPQPLRDELFSAAIAPMRVIATFTGYAKTVTSVAPDGTPTYSTNYTSTTWDITDRISNKAGISLEFQKPYLPLDGREMIITASRVVMSLINTDEAFATEQLGSIVKREGIEQARVVLSLSVNGASYPLYRGKVYGSPDESRGISRIEIRDEFWNIAKSPVTFEKFGPEQVTAVLYGKYDGGSLIAEPAIVQFQHGAVEFYDAITVFGQDSTRLTSVKNTDQDVIQVYAINVLNGAKLGKYEIEMIAPTLFRLSYPDNLLFEGSITTDFTSDFVEIKAGSISVTQGEDPTGKKIEFWVYKTMTGNPVDIIVNEIEKAYTGQYGLPPASVIGLPIDYSAFWTVRQHFPNHVVYVSETNKDNTVWLNLPGKRPMNVLQLCQKIAEHINCQIIVNDWGFISIQMPGRVGDAIYTLSDTDAIISHEVIGTRADNYFKFQYGWNDISATFGAYIVEDERNSGNEEKSIRYINLPYYKQDVSQTEAAGAAKNYMDRILKSLTLVTVKLKPNYAVTMRPGDRVKLVTNTQPRLNGYFEVYESSVEVGQPGVFKLVKIPEPSKVAARFCRAKFCIDTYN